MFDNSWVNDFKSKVDIVDVIKNYVDLRRSGSLFEACCPFHTEKTPSFKVNVQEQYYKCFGCGEGGDVISFIMKKENFTYPEALRFLSEKYNIPLPDNKFVGSENAKYKQMYEINKEAAIFYHKNLLEQKGVAYKYLISRGINEDLMIKFGLGCSLDSEGIRNYLNLKGYSDSSIVDAGLLTKRLSDVFAYRLIVPIIDYKSRVIAFGGRAVKNEHSPKYRNSNNNLTFDKSNALYNINVIRKLSRSDFQFVILVEGYMDVIALDKYGIINSVASMGTALTIEQCKLLKKYTDMVYVCFDGDSAGQKATLSALDILKGVGLEVFAMNLPTDANDPDDFLNKYGVDEFKDLIKNAFSLIDYKLFALEKEYDMKTDYGKERFAKAAVSVLHNLNPIEQEVAVKKISKISGFSEDAITQTFKQELQKASRNQYQQPIGRKNDTNNDKSRIYDAGSLVLSKFFLENNDYVNINDILEDYFEEDSLIEVYRLLRDRLDSVNEENFDVNYLFQLSRELDMPDIKEFASNILTQKNSSNLYAMHKSQYYDSLNFLKENYKKIKLAYYIKELRQVSTEAERRIIQEEINRLIKVK